MTTEPDSLDTRTDADSSSETELRADRPSRGLNSVIVNHEDRPDQRTIYLEGTSGVERMSTWLTADDDTFVALESFR